MSTHQLIAITVMILYALVNPCHAGDPMTPEKARQYLQTEIRLNSDYEGRNQGKDQEGYKYRTHGWGNINNVSFSGDLMSYTCNFTIATRNTDPDDKYPQHYTDRSSVGVTLFLQKINPASIGVEPTSIVVGVGSPNNDIQMYGLTFEPRRPGEKIAGVDYGDSRNKFLGPSLGLLFKDKGVAERVARGIKYLANQAGPEPFGGTEGP